MGVSLHRPMAFHITSYKKNLPESSINICMPPQGEENLIQFNCELPSAAVR